MDGRYVGAKSLEHSVALAGLCGDDGENVDHVGVPLCCVAMIGRRLQPFPVELNRA
jgi:hypothetical protein